MYSIHAPVSPWTLSNVQPSNGRCIMVTAFSVSKTLDADKETWDIVEEEHAEEYTRLLAEERRKGKKSEQSVPLSVAPSGGLLWPIPWLTCSLFVSSTCDENEIFYLRLLPMLALFEQLRVCIIGLS